MFNQNSALMHLCAMALKTVYIIKSCYPRNHTIDYLLANMDDLNEANKATVSSFYIHIYFERLSVKGAKNIETQ